MAFQEPMDPLVQSLQTLIDDLQQEMNLHEFEKTLEQIDHEFPFVNLIDFLEMFIDGKYNPELIKIFHLLGYNEFYKLLEILNLPKIRPSKNNSDESRKINLSNDKLNKRYDFLKSILEPFQNTIREKITYNILRAIVIFQLFSNEMEYTTSSNLLKHLPNAINHFQHLIKTPHDSLENISHEKLKDYLKIILEDLEINQFIEKIDNELRLSKHQLLYSDYIFNIVDNKPEGITYQDLLKIFLKKLPIFRMIPLALIEISLDDFRTRKEFLVKDGYWKLKPYFDQYYTFKNFRQLSHSVSQIQNRKFYGRSIEPEKFIDELLHLDKGNFEDQDDQVTRIAGMVLSNSNMMSHPPNSLKEFDFVIDLSNYQFTKEQEKLIENLSMKISSNVIFIKVMISEKITANLVSELISKLQHRGQNEQGFLISFEEPEQHVFDILKLNQNTIQIITKHDLMEWCKITPTIPCRRGAVAIVRQGDHRDSIVLINSINYESGRADIVLFPDLIVGTQYIGSLEEISLNVSPDDFIRASSTYFQFLSKLRSISETSVFRKIISDGLKINSNSDSLPKIKLQYENRVIDSILCDFAGISKTNLQFFNSIDNSSLKYSTDDLFTCSCYQWNYHSKKHGLCEHLIFTINALVKLFLSQKMICSKAHQERILKIIEQKMDLYLRRLRYCNTNDEINAVCPNCGISCVSIADVESVFGYRQMNIEDKFSLRRQSRCKKCR